MVDQSDAEVYVGLVLRGDFQPEVISAQLGLIPTFAWARGDETATGHRRPLSVWKLSSEKAVEADTIEPHLSWLLDVLEPRAEDLCSVLANASIEGYADCFWASVGMSGGPWIAPTTMARLAALALPLVISFYASESAQ